MIGILKTDETVIMLQPNLEEQHGDGTLVNFYLSYTLLFYLQSLCEVSPRIFQEMVSPLDAKLINSSSIKVAFSLTVKLH